MYAMWVSLAWVCVLGSSMMDLGGDMMVESNQKINSWVEASSLCGNAALQEWHAAPCGNRWLVARILCLWIYFLIGYNHHILLLSLNTTAIPSIARPYVLFL
jgi:hypothetical protein